MRATVFAFATLAAVVGLAPAPSFAAPGDTYKARKAHCQARAKSMNFGIHLIKKNRWVKDCIAGRHPA